MQVLRVVSHTQQHAALNVISCTLRKCLLLQDEMVLEPIGQTTCVADGVLHAGARAIGSQAGVGDLHWASRLSTGGCGLCGRHPRRLQRWALSLHAIIAQTAVTAAGLFGQMSAMTVLVPGQCISLMFCLITHVYVPSVLSCAYHHWANLLAELTGRK